MPVTIHSWWSDRSQTLCGITGISATANLVRYTALPINCPNCITVLRDYGFSPDKHEVSPRETAPPTIQKIVEAIYPTEKPMIEEILEEIIEEEIVEEEIVEEVTEETIIDGKPVNIIKIGTEENPATEEDIKIVEQELLKSSQNPEIIETLPTTVVLHPERVADILSWDEEIPDRKPAKKKSKKKKND